jgi:hypothetical protein
MFMGLVNHSENIQKKICVYVDHVQTTLSLFPKQ